MNWFLVFLGGGIGSVLRFGIGQIHILKQISFPWATLLSNILACLLFILFLSYVQKTPKIEWVQPFLLVGICGGFSTFSTFSYENYQLFQSGNYLFLIANIIVSISVGMGSFMILKLN
jgi:CrcB protein